MADPTFREGAWLYRFKDRTGRWCSPRMKGVTSKGEAKRLNAEKQRLEDRIRQGLEKPPDENADPTFGALLDWWLERRMKGTASYKRNAGSLRKHLIAWTPPPGRPDLDLARLRPAEVTPGLVTDYLTHKKGELAPATLNNLRAWIRAAVNAAIEAGRFHGKNPITKKGVKPQRVPKRKPTFLPAEWIPLVLDDVPAKYQGIFATGIYAGLRKAEILGLLKTDVHIERRQIMVRRTVVADDTKGGHEEGIPIADELLPYLRHALETAPGPLVFPRANGTAYPEMLALAPVLRASLRRLRLGVTGYEMTCRRKGCGHRHVSTDGAPERCPAPHPAHREAEAGEGAPRCGFRLWSCAVIPAEYVFHTTRHSLASHLLMRGADAVAVQRVMRHRDIRVTTEVYGHLAKDYLQEEIGLLAFRPNADPDPAAEGVRAAAGAPSASLDAPVLRSDALPPIQAAGGRAEPQPLSALTAERDIGFEPTTFSLGKSRSDVGTHGSDSEPMRSIGPRASIGIPNSDPLTPFGRRFDAPVLRRGAASADRRTRLTAGGSGLAALPAPLLGVREVAARLGVSTATVYKLCDRGELASARVLNGVIRVEEAALQAFLAARRRSGGRPDR